MLISLGDEKRARVFWRIFGPILIRFGEYIDTKHILRRKKYFIAHYFHGMTNIYRKYFFAVTINREFQRRNNGYFLFFDTKEVVFQIH